MGDAATTAEKAAAKARRKAAGGPVTARGRVATRRAVRALAWLHCPAGGPGAARREAERRAAMRRLWAAVEGLAVTHAGRVCARERVPLEDGLQECYLLLLRCVAGFEPGRNVQFATFFVRAIYCTLTQRMRDARNVVHVPHGRSGAAEQWAGAGWPLESAEAGGRRLAASGGGDPGEALDRADRLERVRLAMVALDDREREILARRYAEGRPTLVELGAALGVSRARVGQVEAAALRKLRVALGAGAG